MKDMVPLGVSGSGLLVITVAISIAGVLLYVLFRGEAEYEREQQEREEKEHGRSSRAPARSPGSPGSPQPATTAT